MAVFLFFSIALSTLTAAKNKNVEIIPIDRLKQEEKRLQKLQKEIKGLSGQVSRFKTEENGLIVQIEKHQLLHNLRILELQGLEQKLKLTNLQIDSLQSEVQKLESRIKENNEYLRVRLRTLYKLGSLNYFRLLLSLKSPSEIKKGMWYLSRLTEEDRNRLLELEQNHSTRGKKLEALKTKHKSLKKLKSLTKKKKQQIANLLDSKENLLLKIQNSISSREMALRELQRASEQMEKLIDTISSGNIDYKATLDIDIKKFIGLLDHPIEGQIIKTFGIEVHPIFKTKIPHNGLTYRATPGTPVCAIFPGIIVFSGRFKGYGNLVIIDHGHDYLSFYSHLLKITVKKAAYITRGEVIGVSGESASLEGPVMYFEIRKNGKPINPMIWLKSREKNNDNEKL